MSTSTSSPPDVQSGYGARPPDWESEIVAAIRAVIRAVDSHSRKLRERHGLTTPQLLVLQELARHESMSAGQLARAVQLGQPTVKVIVDRLEERALLSRRRDEADRRSMRLELSDAGREAVRNAPSLLHESFRRQLAELDDWERTMILSVMQRVGAMMGADDITAAPVLDSEPIPAPAPA